MNAINCFSIAGVLLSISFITAGCGGAQPDNPDVPGGLGAGPQKSSDQQETGQINLPVDSQTGEVLGDPSLDAAPSEGEEDLPIEEPVEEAPIAPPTEEPASENSENDAPPPPPPPAAFSLLRIEVEEMKQDCSGDTVGIEQLQFKMNGAFLSDTFKDHPDSNDPVYNQGKIGVYDATISTSGNFDDFYPFEIFGGGFGAGWFSERSSFMDNVSPTPAIKDVWVQISFTDVELTFDSLFVNGGSTDLLGFEACSPSKLKVLGSNDGETWAELAVVAQDTQNGLEIPLSYPLSSPSLVATSD